MVVEAAGLNIEEHTALDDGDEEQDGDEREEGGTPMGSSPSGGLGGTPHLGFDECDRTWEKQDSITCLIWLQGNSNNI